MSGLTIIGGDFEGQNNNGRLRNEYMREITEGSFTLIME